MDRRTALRQFGSAAAALGLAGCSGPGENPDDGTATATTMDDRPTSTSTDRATESSTATETETPTPSETDSPTAAETDESTPGETDAPTSEATDTSTPAETDTPTPSETDAPGDEATYYEFSGELSGWYGREPPGIDGEENPTITLRPGATYEITWTNRDGKAHRFAIEDARGNKLVQSEKSSEQGATETTTFEATERMAAYYCTFHPSTMRGDVRSGD